MDPINIFIAINIFLLFFANVGGAKKGIRTAVGSVKDKSNSKLQAVPYLSALILVIVIISLFGVGTLDYSPARQTVRIIALVIYICASWLQIRSMKTLGESYSQEIVILKNHQLITGGMYKRIRHPHYLFQIIGDLAVSIAVLSFIAFPLAIIQVPLLVLRAIEEERLLKKHFQERFLDYQKTTSSLIPYLW